MDDFYATSSKLVILETTFHCFNGTLYDTTPATHNGTAIFTWLRSMIAVLASKSGPQFVDFFSRENSGTYNNQWLILDHKLYDNDCPPRNNFLWILEQMPGHIWSGDRT